MSEIGSGPDDLNIGSGAPGNQPDGSFYNLYPAGPQPGLFGGQFASQQASAPVGMAGVDAAALGVNPDISGDGTGHPPSVTIAPNLPQQVGAGPAGSSAPEPFNLYDTLRRGLNTPFGSDALQIVQGLSQGMEKYAPFAEGLGAAGAVGGAVTGNLPFAAGSAGLAALGLGMDGLGHGMDAGVSFLKSIQQDNNQPLADFKQRMETPDFYDLKFPGPDF